MAPGGRLSEAPVYYLGFITCRVACSLFLTCTLTTRLEDPIGWCPWPAAGRELGPRWPRPTGGRRLVSGSGGRESRFCCGAQTHWPRVGCPEAVWGHCHLVGAQTAWLPGEVKPGWSAGVRTAAFCWLLGQRWPAVPGRGNPDSLQPPPAHESCPAIRRGHLPMLLRFSLHTPRDRQLTTSEAACSIAGWL